MTKASLPLQEAVYGALTGDSALMALIIGVYDYAPEDTGFPYVQIGETTVADWSAKGLSGEEHTLTLHVWAQGRGHAAVKQVMAAVQTVLDDASLTLSGHQLISMRFLFADILRDPDGITHHGVMRFRAFTQDT